MNKYQKVGSIIALILGSSAAANAAVLYNNLPADVTSYDSGLGISGAGFYDANKFSTSTLCPSGCTLGNITLNLSSNDSSTAGYQLQVVADATGRPGATLISLNNPANFSTTGDNNLFAPTGTFNLAAGTNYWVKLIDSAQNGPVYWNYNNAPAQAVSNQPAQIAYDLGFGFQQPPSGLAFLMKVEATPLSSVPVPGAIWMMGSALIGLVASWRKKAS
jgi:hypothetical protein